jgi:hypothetical protein
MPPRKALLQGRLHEVLRWVKLLDWKNAFQVQQTLRMQSPSERPDACLARVGGEYPTIKPLKLGQGHIHILCHHPFDDCAGSFFDCLKGLGALPDI